MRLSNVWVFFLPLLYLPNLGYARDTAFGTLKISDYLIIPYAVLVLLAVRRDPMRRNYDLVWPWLLGFVVAAFISTITIVWRYPATTNHALVFGMLKLAKFSLYAASGLLTARALANTYSRKYYNWALLVAALIVAVALLAMPNQIEKFRPGLQGLYDATNGTSVMVSILLAYLVGRLITRAMSGAWSRATALGIPVIALGLAVSRGRGGWVALIASFAYMVFRLGFRRQVILVLVAGTLAVWIGYAYVPSFRHQVDMTLRPKPQYVSKYHSTVLGINDGSRTAIWLASAGKVWEAPILGAGFYHRGPSTARWGAGTGLFITGSHNFWLEMLLETGFLGFGLLSTAGYSMWRLSGERNVDERGLSLSVQTAFVAAFVGGLSGEYFYGGMELFTVLAVWATVGALPVLSESVRTSGEQSAKDRGARQG